MMIMIFIFVACAGKSEARKISTSLLKKKLVACTQIFPMESSYWWKGKIEHAKEWLVIAKSVERNFGRIKTEVKKLHSYEVPEIVAVDAEADEDYKSWLASTLL